MLFEILTPVFSGLWLKRAQYVKIEDSFNALVFEILECRSYSAFQGRTKMINLEKAMLDPTAVFDTPAQLLATDELNRNQKIEILRRWEYDAHELEVAEEEAGMAVRRPEMFDLVVKALNDLGAKRDTAHTPPTK